MRMKKKNRGCGGLRCKRKGDAAKKKLRESDGFTLIEMLVVVAIVAVLIAISIPMIGSALEKARHSTDAANERAAKTAFLAEYTMGGGLYIAENSPYYYNAADGKIWCRIWELDDFGNPIGSIAPYGKHDKAGQFLALKLIDGQIYMKWVSSPVTASSIKNEGLCSLSESVNH